MTGEDDAFLREFLTTFVGSGAQVVAGIDVSLADDDRVAIGGVAHKLKGAAAVVYAVQLVDAAGRLENNAATFDRGQLEASIREVRSSLEECVSYISGSLVAEEP
jgi:histidine phosphotransfer protein HptB